jgi:hypothetical protein
MPFAKQPHGDGLVPRPIESESPSRSASNEVRIIGAEEFKLEKSRAIWELQFTGAMLLHPWSKPVSF